MTARLQVYKCEKCGNIVEILHEGAGQLICCNEPMALMKENTVDAAKEKHVPIIETTDTGATVKVGQVAHPMEDKHYIEWIEINADGKVYRAFLDPGGKPETMFDISATSIIARAYCNIHGLWKS